jgi:hypothetical protein
MMKTFIRQFIGRVGVQVDDGDFADLCQSFLDKSSECVRVRPEIPIEECLVLVRIIIAKDSTVGCPGIHSSHPDLGSSHRLIFRVREPFWVYDKA